MKRNFKSNRKAFTLVELLIVIAIIGILFIVLVSKVDFATDKAKTTGVQTDFRSFQVAFETVSRENSGFNTLGWDTGDKADASLIAGYTYENADKDGGDRIRNSYDKGDLNLNGICEDGETWTGRKIYTETWTGIYTLDNPGDATDMSAYILLETAINKNLDPALQISIDPENKTIYMANGYQDPWQTEYHGFYLSNAANDGMDRGAVVMYSDGPNKVFGSEQTIAKGIVSVTVKNGGINGQDDLALVTCYTYMNGYGEIATTTEGFSNNQVLSGNGNSGVNAMFGPGEGGYTMFDVPTAPITVTDNLILRSSAPINKFIRVKLNGEVVDPDNYTVTEGSTIIKLKNSYLKTLPNGEYNIEIVSIDGSASCNVIFDRCVHPDGFVYGGVDSEGLCLICHNECLHPEYEISFSREPVLKHSAEKRCVECGYFSYPILEDCTIDETGTCVVCGYYCSHFVDQSCNCCSTCGTVSYEFLIQEYIYIGNDKHEIFSKCTSCGQYLDSPPQEGFCEFENGKCKYCS